ncbi:MAG: FAD-dependent monooxygenase [Microcystis sp.]
MKTDVVIIGGGPGGLTSSILLEQAGIKSVVVEKEKFPRYHIGESLTGEAGKTLRLLGLEDKMQFSEYPIKYGVRVYGKE